MLACYICEGNDFHSRCCLGSSLSRELGQSFRWNATIVSPHSTTFAGGVAPSPRRSCNSSADAISPQCRKFSRLRGCIASFARLHCGFWCPSHLLRKKKANNPGHQGQCKAEAIQKQVKYTIRYRIVLDNSCQRGSSRFSMAVGRFSANDGGQRCTNYLTESCWMQRPVRGSGIPSALRVNSILSPSLLSACRSDRDCCCLVGVVVIQAVSTVN
ncbi:uncharacterized protein BDV14DRAFT_132173 [Aspergillus stella-maris]|uniref:uncharacterized protein n=1 Tax=Aspergillus stella-maris TaxID=1810926 RepID=UPI003CCD0CC1